MCKYFLIITLLALSGCASQPQTETERVMELFKKYNAKLNEKYSHAPQEGWFNSLANFNDKQGASK